MDRNPYEVENNKHTSVVSKSEPSRNRKVPVEMMCVVVFVGFNLLSAYLISTFINTVYRLNMRTWVIPYYLLVVITTLPLAFVAVKFGKWMKRSLGIIIVLYLASILAFLLPYGMLLTMRDSKIGFYQQCVILITWTSSWPVLLVVAIRCTIGKWGNQDQATHQT